MSESNIFVPVESIDERLRELIPPEDKILYTSRGEIVKTGFMGDRKFGYLVLTNNGVAFRGGKMGFMTASVVSAARGALNEYVLYKDIVKFENKKNKVKFKHKIPDKPDKTRGWQLKVEREKELEDKESFKERKKLFGKTFEDLVNKAKSSSKS